METLEKKSPDYVFIGDSMVESRIDLATLERLTSARVALLWDGGSTSARWYLFLKNYLIPSGIKPKRVFLFFRDWSLSLPRHRLTGVYREGNERAMRPDDTLVQRFMDEQDGRDHKGLIGNFLNFAYPIQRRGMAVREAITERFVEYVSAGKHDRKKVVDDLEDTFALKQLREDLGADLPVLDEEDEPVFSSDPDASFLPHIIDVSTDADLPLVLVRVKRRPKADGVTAESPQLRQYLKDLREYLEKRGIPFYDETPAREIPVSWYADGDHISPKRKAAYTERFYRVLGRFFE